MLEITVFFIVAFFMALWPVMIPYLALSYLFISGLASRAFMAKVKVSLGSVNVFPLDLLYAMAACFSVVFLVRAAFLGEMTGYGKFARRTIWIVLLYLLFFAGKLINGFLANMPIDSLIRMFMTDTQAFYFFLPLAVYKDVAQFKKIMVFTGCLALLFPLYQPLLYGSVDSELALHSQDTLRLGYGDGAILLGIGVVAFICWEYKKYLAFLPMSGILMLGHRSAFIALGLSVISISLFKGKKIKTLFMVLLSAIMVVITLMALQSFAKINMLDKLLDRVEQTFVPTKTTIVRARVIVVVLEELEKRPLTGLAYSELAGVIKRADTSPRDFNIYHPHNFIYSSLMGAGLLGTFLMVVIIFRSLLAARKLVKSDAFRLQGVYIFSSVLFFLVFSAMNTTMTTCGYVLWFFCGVSFWFLNYSEKNEIK
ncbi:hypothetical protein BJL95_13475 [Methylomonas sp. LWB]|uniref:O-antigen ligase family protein n=1 Tax=Methylomonas sp. LWB TaxID=1905845 RepID=UPI0008DA9923|nr:O-antigen ligase family protein [Methylomonas sp. LWB]OHX37578.1 hypothetical protein BJL95_13475 [Methylomonas sp. LWB]